VLLGAPRIEVGGEPIEVDTRKAIALVAYLAITRGHHARDALAGLLWPEYNQTRARAALRRTLSSLATARAEGWLEVDRESVDLDRSKVWVDVDRFRKLLAECRAHGHPEGEVCPECLPPLSESAELYRDDFLAGFALRDSAAFDDWQFFQSEELRRELAGALERLSRGHGALEEWEQAVSYGRRWLALDPLHEPAHRWLVQLYAWAGQRASALRQYRECVRVLEEELGVSPLEETTRIYESIKENDLPPPPVFSDDRASPPQTEEPPEGHTLPHDEPLVGREEELASLLRAYEAAGTGGHVAVLEGEAGIGKTRLAEEFLSYAARRGSVTIAARCYQGEMDLAYGPFVEGLSAAVQREGVAARLGEVPAHLLAEAARLVPELADLRPGLPSPPPLETPGAQSRFFEGIGRVLLATCEGPSPGVLFIDDVHWADASSLDLLAYVVRRLRSGRLCVVLTWREEETPSDHRLRGVLNEAQRSRAATVVRLSRLDRAAVEELVGATVGHTDGLGGRLYDETEGLPLFVGEYLAAITSGSLAAEDEAWSLPGGVRGLLHGRLGAVGETGRQLLHAAAAIGRSFDFDTVREVSGRSEEEAVAALEELIQRGLVEEVKGAGQRSVAYDFGHEKLRALVYEETSLARRRLLHRRVAESLAQRANRRRETGALAGQIAHHLLLAGRDQEAGELFRVAGEHARVLYANAEALSHFRAALALGHPDAADLHEAVGDLQTLLGEYGEALASYETAAALGDGDHLSSIERKLGNVYQRLGKWELAESHLEAALEGALEGAGSTGELARLHADLSLVAHQRGEPALALERARRALELAETDERALARSYNVLGVLASASGDLDGARRHLERSLELAEALGDAAGRVAALNNLALALANGGDLEQALESAESALALCVALGDRHREAALHNNLADLLHVAGRQEESMSHLKQAVEIFAEVGEEGELQPEIWKLVEW
jgi:predicted ATPase/DNA-binding SARP family transcriptional activator